MEYLQTFNEHQKRAFKSFQTEKQAERDKKAEEERKKNQPVYNYNSYGYTQGKIFHSKESGGQWMEESTWVEGRVPTYNDDVVINGTVYLKLQYNYKSCEDLTINDGKTLIITSGVTLTIFGDFINNGTIELENGANINNRTVYTTLSLDGNFTAGDGSVVKKGENASITTKRGVKVCSSTIPKEPTKIDTKQLKLPPPKVTTDGETGINNEHTQALMDLFPSFDINKLDLYGNCTRDISLTKIKTEITKDTDYEILPLKNSSGEEVSIINNHNRVDRYKKLYFRLYKKYNFNAYVMGFDRDVADIVDPDGKKIRSLGYGLTYKKVYKLIGETSPGIHYGKYEIVDDYGDRKAYPKNWFSLPFKIEYTEGTPKRVYSKTEIEKIRNSLLRN